MTTYLSVPYFLFILKLITFLPRPPHFQYQDNISYAPSVSANHLFHRYEDFCRDPYRQANKLFEFLNAGRVNDSRTTTLHSPNRGKIYNLLVKANLLSPGESLNSLPDNTLRFLLSHTLVNPMAKRTPWTTVRNTLTTYQQWRIKITQEDLRGVEQACIPVLQHLRHILFHNVSRARDLTISLSDTSLNKL